MSVYQITGGRTLGGCLEIQGAKNSVLPILAASLLSRGECVIHNCPRLTDVTAALEILKQLGCKVRQEGHTVTVDAAAPTRWDVSERLMREMRSSVIFMGALLARMGAAELSCPGGCELGPRPIDLHLAAFRQLGAELRESGGAIHCEGGARMRGTELCLPIPSVGATENIMLAACGCSGTTTIVGAAREPEIMDLQRFLQSLGAQVTGAGSTVISIEGGRILHGTEYTVMGDRIAAATCLCTAAAAGGEIQLTGVNPGHLSAVLSRLSEAGSVVHTQPEGIVLRQSGPLQGGARVTTAPYPGFPTDAQAILMAALAGGSGTTVFVENMFDSRYRHVDELRRMGADIQTAGRTAVVTGRGRLHGAAVRGTDLRGAAALVVAGAAAEGTTYVDGLEHIRRGYQNLAEDLAALGVDICEVSRT